MSDTTSVSTRHDEADAVGAGSDPDQKSDPSSEIISKDGESE